MSTAGQTVEAATARYTLWLVICAALLAVAGLAQLRCADALEAKEATPGRAPAARSGVTASDSELG
jgi:hypothetical protein